MPNPFDSKVVSIDDIRARRLGQMIDQQIIEDQDNIMAEFSDTEKVWWRNQQFFAERLARGQGYGRCAYQVGTLEDGTKALRFECEAYGAFYQLEADLTINFDSPVLFRWSHSSPAEFQLVSEADVKFTPEQL